MTEKFFWNRMARLVLFVVIMAIIAWAVSGCGPTPEPQKIYVQGNGAETDTAAASVNKIPGVTITCGDSPYTCQILDTSHEVVCFDRGNSFGCVYYGERE